MTRTRLFNTHSRTAVAGAVAGSVLVVSMGVAVASSGASSTYVSASPSAFCTTLLTFHAKAPTGTNYKSYRAWAKTYLPFWKKLASEAPNKATKKVLGELVTIVKYEANAKSEAALGKYISTHQTQWTNGWKAFSTAAVSCATSMY